MKTLAADRAVVLLSGGQDSTTCLYWALAHFRHVQALQFDYGQRHRVELGQAATIAEQAGVQLTTLALPAFQQLAGSALTDPQTPVQQDHNPQTGLPNTFVPGRNLIFLTWAAALAYQAGAQHIVGGMCQTDYAGYPDCRAAFIESAQSTLRLATEADFRLHTPLMNLTKAETWQLAHALGCLAVVRDATHTCYNGDRQHWHPWGYGCNACTACQLRRQGYEEAFGPAAY